MALWFPIMVNDFEVGRVELVRILPVDHRPVQDEQCIYDLKYFDLHANGEFKLSYYGVVIHPYQEKNPIPLLTAALEELNG